MARNEENLCENCGMKLEESAINLEGVWVRGLRCPKCGLEVPTKNSYMEALYTKRGDANARWIR
jgi:adenine-specific DNA methylase